MSKQPVLTDVLSTSPLKEEGIEAHTANDYEALTPSIIGPEESGVYTDALNFACSRPDIKNIAVTGAYGAGKSSVLKTWKECPDNDLLIMTVSLADFEMQSAVQPKTQTGNAADDKKAAAEEKTIEYSILQQLLYKEKKSALPYSRIERIADITSFQIAAIAGHLLLILSITLAGLFCLFPEYIRKKLSLSDMLSQFLLDVPAVRLGAAWLLLFASLYLTVKKLHRMGLFDRRVSVDKIDLSKGAMAISTRPSSPSLLNVYIDEIVYFFEQTGYNVVIFEDLDRHNDGAIFIKLREINQIINNTRPDIKPVRFIYAVRDGLFSTAEARTKFFDFLIPVIPVMDSENAAEHFRGMFRKEELDTEGFTKCISRLSLFIPDMRIMRNIANEFRIHQNLVNGADDITRLLSMIAYKNICAEDYHAIDDKKGVLYAFVKSFVSGKLKSEPVNDKNHQINKIQEEIKSLYTDEAKSNRDIRENILSGYITAKQMIFLQFSLPIHGIVNSDVLAENEQMFENLLSQTGFGIVQRNTNRSLVTFDEGVIKSIAEEYERRKAVLRQKTEGHVDQLNIEIDKLRREINAIDYAGLADFAVRMGSSEFINWINENLYSDEAVPGLHRNSTEQEEFIYLLLSNGYIASDYMFYRSVFRPGSLSLEDNDFIKAVSIGRPSEQTLVMPLIEVENVITKLYSLGLMIERRAWHPAVLLFLLENDSSKLHSIAQAQLSDQYQWSLQQLSEQAFKNWNTAQRISYVELMAASEDKAYTLMQALALMGNKSVASELLILHMCSRKLVWNSTTNTMRAWASNILGVDGSFADQVPEGYGQFFVKNLKKRNVHITSLSECFSVQGREIVRKIAETPNWEYSADNLKNIFLTLSDATEVSRESFQETPLAAIETMDIPRLKKSVWENINKFIADYFIHSQEHDRIPELLTDNRVSAESIYRIVTRMQFFVEGIRGIKNRSTSFEGGESSPEGDNLYSLLLERNRIRADWREFSYLLQQDDIPDRIIAKWFNENNSGLEDRFINSGSYDLISRLMQRIYKSAELGDAARQKILSNLNLTFLSLPGTFTLEQTALLIKFKRLAPTDEIFTQVHDSYLDKEEGQNELLTKLVAQRPELLINHPQLVLFDDDEFDYPLSERLYRDEKIMKSAGVNSLSWLWGYKPEVFEGPMFIPAESLRYLVPGLKNVDLRLALLLQGLRAGNLPHQIITLVLSSLSNDDYLIFLSTKAHRSVPYTDSLIEMAKLLVSSGFIQSLKLNEARQRIRFVPHNSPSFRRT